MLGDDIYTFQWTNRVIIANLASAVMRRNKIAARVIPKGFLLSLLDTAGNVEDPDLQSLWARLLASAAVDDRHQHPAYIRTLERMNGEDARVFRARLNGSRRTFPDQPMLSPFADYHGDTPGTYLADSRLLGLGLVTMQAAPAGMLVNVSGFGLQFAAAVMPDLVDRMAASPGAGVKPRGGSPRRRPK